MPLPATGVSPSIKMEQMLGSSSRVSKGFSFAEVGFMRTKDKVTCCDFSSNGEILAIGGNEKKAVLWNMNTLQTETTPEDHHFQITDIRFRPNSTQFATASFDKSVRLWDATDPDHCLNAYTEHSYPTMSLDFHPKKTDLFCFCDIRKQIHYWTVSPFSSIRLSKQRSFVHVRFQPTGHLLAAPSGKVVSIYDVETDRQTHSFKAHYGIVSYLCWNMNGDLLATVCERSVTVWSLASGESINVLNISSNCSGQYHSCVFHPRNRKLLVIGGTQSLNLWNLAENRSETVDAPTHESIISTLAGSSQTGMVATAGHDCSVKLWN